MSYNPGLLFYKHYYEGIQFGNKDTLVEKKNERKFKTRNDLLLATRFLPNTLPAIGKVPELLAFPLTTTYPGLILGTGYAHGSGLQGEFKTGFYFDHTTGMPRIPGSSVKGLLRSTFPGLFYEKAKNKDVETEQFWKKLGDNRAKFIASIIQALGYDLGKDPDPILRLEREIFEGMHGDNREKHDHHFAMRDRDVFFDALITASADGQIFSDEYITPHKKPLKNPIPIQILKVRPGVTFTFSFKLKPDYQIERDGNTETQPRMLTPAQRLELFRQILMFLGAGAKTNSGFGHFEADKQVDLSGRNPTPPSAGAGEKPVQPGQPAATSPAQKKYPSLLYDRKLSGNKELVGELLRREGENGWFRLLNVANFDKEVKVSHALMPDLAIGAHYLLSAGRVVPADNVLEVKIINFKPQ